MPLFQNSVLKKYLATQDHTQVHQAFGAYLTYFHNPIIRENIRASKEEQFQEGFLRALFVNILGYTLHPEPEYNLTTELKNIKDSKKTDGAILRDGKAIAVIELKGADTKDLEKIRDQAFNYKNNQPDCVYVITSNFEKLRFYIHNAVDFIEFSILHMQQEEFRLLWLLLQKDNLLSGIPQQIKAESLLVEEQVTKKLYADYSSFKQELWQDIVRNNPGNDELLLYKKSQKLLDRFLFIFFAEDKGLLPPNSISEIVKQWDKLAEMDEYRPLYDRFKKYFGYMNTGRALPGKAEIHAYNGGLFAPDPLLDSLKISDALLKTHVSKLTEYDFESEVDTNILGHIFEHSLNDIENVRASLDGTAVDKSKTKRKKDGVFYTPKYITKYIVDNTVGKLCTEKKAELGIVDEDFAKGKAGRKKDTLLKLVAQLKAYREWLLQLAICDPACGSGAFLNQVLEFLMAEHRYLDELESMLFESSIVFPNVEKHILENNIFGVDINEESVEIARLSLWLRTAQKGRKLSSLSSNIKVGNSLIDDPEVAGELAFNWQREFPQVFAKGGFDVVVGNPPYGADISTWSIYLSKKYSTYTLRGESYVLFTERGINIINVNGFLGFIIPDTYLNLGFTKPLRDFILQNSLIEEIALLPAKVFESAIVDTTILNVRKKVKFLPFYEKNVDVSITNKKDQNFTGNGFQKQHIVNTSIWFETGIFQILSNKEDFVIIDKLDRCDTKVSDIADLYSGIKAYEVGKGNPPQTSLIRDTKPFTSDKRKALDWSPFFEGKDIERYFLAWENNSWIKYGEWLAAPRNPENFIDEKILIRKIISKRLIAHYVPYTSFCNTLLFVLKIKSGKYSYLFLLGILNSTLMGWYFKNKFQISSDDTFPQIMIRDIFQFPLKYEKEIKLLIEEKIKLLIENLEEQSKIKTGLYYLVTNKFSLIKPSTKLQNWTSLDFKGFLGELVKAKVKLSLSEEADWMAYFHEQKVKAFALQSDISRLDAEIDKLVYELYGLTEEEIRIVEGRD